MSPALVRMVIIVHPGFSTNNGNKRPGLNDYVIVPISEIRGTFKFQEIVNSRDLGAMASLYYNLQKR